LQNGCRMFAPCTAPRVPWCENRPVTTRPQPPGHRPVAPPWH
jgi:hypothetical protein